MLNSRLSENLKWTGKLTLEYIIYEQIKSAWFAYVHVASIDSQLSTRWIRGYTPHAFVANVTAVQKFGWGGFDYTYIRMIMYISTYIYQHAKIHTLAIHIKMEKTNIHLNRYVHKFKSLKKMFIQNPLNAFGICFRL